MKLLGEFCATLFCLWLVVVDAKVPELQSWLSKYKLELEWDAYNSLPAAKASNSRIEEKPRETVVFVHAVFGKFKYTRKDRKGQYWGMGEAILKEMLTVMFENATFMHSIDHIFLTCLGSAEDIEAGLVDMQESPLYGASIGTSIHANKLKVLLKGQDKFMWEFPTLAILQHYSTLLHPQSKILYLHTKGVRRNGLNDNNVNDWRRYMMYWAVETATDVCMKALDGGSTVQGLDFQYDTCGSMKRGGTKPFYGGNFWWTSANYISNKEPAVADLRWDPSPEFRFKAEEYLLRNSSPWDQEHRHYCTHHTHQNMNSCRTPRDWYALRGSPDVYSEGHGQVLREMTKAAGMVHGGVIAQGGMGSVPLAAYPMRANGNCFHIDYQPKNRTKDPVTWCHIQGRLPWTSDQWDERQRAETLI